jgi:hypothetical protein
MVSRDDLRVRYRRDELDLEDLEGEGRFLWRLEPDPLQGVAAVRQILAEETLDGRSLWVDFNWLGEPALEVALQQRARLAGLVESYPLVVATGVVEPELPQWPAEDVQRRLLESRHCIIRYARQGLLLSRVVVARSCGFPGQDPILVGGHQGRRVSVLVRSQVRGEAGAAPVCHDRCPA